MTYYLLAAAIESGTVVSLGLAALVIIAIVNGARVVPQRNAYVVERLGKYSRTLDAGFHILIPFLDRVTAKHSLKEQVVDVPSQMCITRDNIAIEIDGVLFLQVLDPMRATYGVTNYFIAATQLAQTTLRSEIGKMELDRSFEERDSINANIVEALDKATEPWGLKIMRYEISNINPPQSVKDALEKQMRAERERRAQVAMSEGDRESRINVAEGQKQEVIKQSEALKQKQINEAEGKAQEIELIATATASGLRMIADAIRQEGGRDAVNLRIAEQYVGEFGKIASKTNTMIIPSNMSDIGGMVASLGQVLDRAGRTSVRADEPVAAGPQATTRYEVPAGFSIGPHAAPPLPPQAR
jgi:regulator of protease activity HflC (stomatin/prohibitin superfamily)